MIIDSKQLLLVSSNLVLNKYGKQYIVYNSLFGFPTVLNRSGLRLINLFKKPKTLNQIEQEYDIENLKDWINLFVNNRFLRPVDFDERQFIRQRVDKTVQKIVSGKFLESLGLICDTGCNLDCSYCLNKKMRQVLSRKSKARGKMKWQTAKMAIDNFLSTVAKDKVEIYFGGGEAFRNWDLVEKVVAYCLNNFGSHYKFIFSTNTNATLITSKRAKFLSKHDFIITTSLDGPSKVNNSVRFYYSGNGTYDDILKSWDNLENHNKKVEWFCLTLTDNNIYGIKESFFDFLCQRGIKSCSFEPDLVMPLKITPEELVEKLIWFKELAIERKISLGGMWDKGIKNMFEEDIKKRMFGCSAFTGRGISVLPSGDIVPCSYSAKIIGKIKAMQDLLASTEYQSLISSRAIGQIKECIGCEIEGQCLGGCYITTEYCEYKNSDDIFQYRCKIFKLITKHLLEKAVMK